MSASGSTNAARPPSSGRPSTAAHPEADPTPTRPSAAATNSPPTVKPDPTSERSAEPSPTTSLLPGGRDDWLLFSRRTTLGVRPVRCRSRRDHGPSPLSVANWCELDDGLYIDCHHPRPTTTHARRPPPAVRPSIDALETRPARHGVLEVLACRLIEVSLCPPRRLAATRTRLHPHPKPPDGPTPAPPTLQHRPRLRPPLAETPPRPSSTATAGSATTAATQPTASTTSSPKSRGRHRRPTKSGQALCIADNSAPIARHVQPATTWPALATRPQRSRTRRTKPTDRRTRDPSFFHDPDPLDARQPAHSRSRPRVFSRRRNRWTLVSRSGLHRSGQVRARRGWSVRGGVRRLRADPPDTLMPSGAVSSLSGRCRGRALGPGGQQLASGPRRRRRHSGEVPGHRRRDPSPPWRITLAWREAGSVLAAQADAFVGGVPGEDAVTGRVGAQCVVEAR